MAERVTVVLIRHGVSVWFSRRNLRGSQNWHAEIGYALRRCDWLVLLASPNAVESMWVEREAHYAVNRPRFRGKILPLILDPCDLEAISWTLPDIQHIDIRDFERGMRQLLATWGIGFRP